jgi:aspartyl-tRNA(Asn)/glutamyl-tRNA(Gln) amidotransferase subunit C
MKLSLEQVQHVATLARLALTPDEARLYQTQLSAILDAVEQLNELPTSDVEPTSHATLAASLLRADEVRPSLPEEKALANAPVKVGTRFAVPKILE